MELWKEIKDCESYQVSNLGNIKNIITGKLRKPNIKNGYCYTSMNVNDNEKSLRIHRLVAQAFLVNDDENKTYVNHIDGNKLNNKLDNLEWITPSNNVKHACETGLLESQARKVLQYDKKGIFIKEYESINDASIITSIDDGSICKVCKGNGVNKSAGGFIWKYKDDSILCKTDQPADLTKIKNYPNYSITKDGKVYSHLRKRYLIEGDVDGYSRVYIINNEGRKGHLVHRLVAETFIPNPDGKPQVNHKDKNRKNNNSENLEWVTQVENSLHKNQTSKSKH
jgi:hypothetical protein